MGRIIEYLAGFPKDTVEEFTEQELNTRLAEGRGHLLELDARERMPFKKRVTAQVERIIYRPASIVFAGSTLGLASTGMQKEAAITATVAVLSLITPKIFDRRFTNANIKQLETEKIRRNSNLSK